MRAFKVLWGTVFAACVAFGVLAVVASDAMAMGCEVENTETHVKYTGSLQEAVSPAQAGTALKVKGTCDGNTVIAKNLAIAGKAATLKGEGGASVVTVEKAVTVAIRGVTITGGSGDEIGGGGHGYGGGIYNEGTLTLSKSTVTGNEASNEGYGGGIFSEGTATLEKSTVSANSASSGGGLDNEHGTMTLVKSRVNKNGANESGAVRTTSTLTIEDSKITENSAPSIIGFHGEATIAIKDHSLVTGSSGSRAGGLELLNAKSLTVENSKIEHNQGTSEGGAIWAEGTPVTLVDARVKLNEAPYGGGVYLTGGASLKTKDHSKVTKNTATGGAEHGGGVFNSSSAGAVEEEDAGEITKNAPENLYTEPQPGRTIARFEVTDKVHLASGKMWSAWPQSAPKWWVEGGVLVGSEPIAEETKLTTPLRLEFRAGEKLSGVKIECTKEKIKGGMIEGPASRSEEAEVFEGCEVVGEELKCSVGSTGPPFTPGTITTNALKATLEGGSPEKLKFAPESGKPIAAFEIREIDGGPCAENNFEFKADGEMICNYKEVETEEPEHPLEFTAVENKVEIEAA